MCLLLLHPLHLLPTTFPKATEQHILASRSLSSPPPLQRTDTYLASHRPIIMNPTLSLTYYQNPTYLSRSIVITSNTQRRSCFTNR
ncbi:hypothetical protein M8C21_026870 [Ambrosia artemisiifolia]|uniref:Uncharacterized protein n=1 Tax=Ambrosia artemisiifolia TaxID=4212 RepID=A0AAD5BXF1_AMBAR|nr:hypothetical protein M8C21_026870 [Ambrosia artemisiifolia]